MRTSDGNLKDVSALPTPFDSTRRCMRSKLRAFDARKNQKNEYELPIHRHQSNSRRNIHIHGSIYIHFQHYRHRIGADLHTAKSEESAQAPRRAHCLFDDIAIKWHDAHESVRSDITTRTQTRALEHKARGNTYSVSAEPLTADRAHVCIVVKASSHTDIPYVAQHKTNTNTNK